jgi:hypothetical protein
LATQNSHQQQQLLRIRFCLLFQQKKTIFA